MGERVSMFGKREPTIDQEAWMIQRIADIQQEIHPKLIELEELRRALGRSATSDS